MAVLQELLPLLPKLSFCHIGLGKLVCALGKNGTHIDDAIVNKVACTDLACQMD